MAFVHGKSTFLSVGGANISPFTTTSSIEKNADSHDVTTYGQDAHVFRGGLLNGTGSASGIYDRSTSSGPADMLEPLVGQNVALVRRTEGTGTGKPQQTVDALITKYTETNPVADMVTWSVDFQLSGTIAKTTQT